MNRADLLREAGTAALVTEQALNMWDAGDRRGALRLMHQDGAERDWLTMFVGAQEDITAAEADALVDEVAADDG